MTKKQYFEAGQAVIETCVCVIAIVIVFLGLIFVCGLGISDMQDLIKAKDRAGEKNSRFPDKTWDNDDLSGWDFRSQQQQQRQTTEPDFFPGSHLFYNSRGGNINPFSANDLTINNANTGNANQAAPPVPSDFQSTFLRELSPANQVKKNEAAATGVSRNIPPLFVGAEEVSGGLEPADESAFPDMTESQDAGTAKRVNK